MAINERKSLIFTAIAVSLVGILTGLFLGGDLLPSQGVPQLYDVRRTTTKTVTTMVDAEGEHTITTVVTTTETVPRGYNFPMPMTAGTTPAATASIPAQGANEVWMVGREFRPFAITVPVGTTVTWTSKSDEFHTITSDTGLFEGSLEYGQSFSYTFTEPGVFSYHCEIETHAGMAGTVTVQL